MSNNQKNNVDNKIPLVSDLDGTLIQGDILKIGISKLLKKNPLNFFYCILWLLNGRPHLKKKIFEVVKIDPQQLVFNYAVLSFLKDEFAKGRQIVLATATLSSVAIEIAGYCGIFNKVYATENNINLKGKNKLSKLVQEYGDKGFDYIGDSPADLPIFKHCRYAYLVKPSRWLEKKTNKKAAVKNIWH